MSYADIADLGLEEPTHVPVGEYVPPTNNFDPIQPGSVRAQMIEGKFKDRDTGVESIVRYGKTRSNQLSAEIALRILDGQYTNRLLFHRLNTVRWGSGAREGMNAYLAFLRDIGVTEDIGSGVDYGRITEDLIDEGKSFNAGVDFEWHCNPNAEDYIGCGNRMKYVRKVGEKLDDGTWSVRLRCNDPSHDDGEAPTLKARNIITRVSV